MDEREEVFLSSLVREDTNKRAKKKKTEERSVLVFTGRVRTQFFYPAYGSRKT